MRVTIIGGGAAGCFAAVNLKRMAPLTDITVLEAGRKILAKVAITGGGRCNLTNTFEGISDLKEAYPRGDKLMRRLFNTFGPRETRSWFEKEGVRLVTMEEGCIFPASQDAMQIVGTLSNLMTRLGITVKTGCRVHEIRKEGSRFRIISNDGSDILTDQAAVMTGGGSSPILSPLALGIVPPVPSLFTFNIGDEGLRKRMGLVVPGVSLGIPGTNFRSHGTLLITDWGISGPATLKLSSFAARYLNEMDYRSPLLIRWLGDMDLEDVRDLLESFRTEHARKLVSSAHPAQLPGRLWEYLIEKSGIREDQRWAETGTKGLNRLAETLFADPYRIEGRCAFKEEFVTCGGVALSEISYKTLECKKHPGLFFAGEALDIDAITGGFNLQAAWTTGYVVAKSLSESYGDGD